MILVSVIIPVYNVADYLDECLKSVLCQTYRNLEIILVDDGSTDNSGDICEKYRQIDSRVHVIHQCNSGQACARNAGMSYSHGEYIAFVDSDDVVEPLMIEVLLNACIKYNCPMSCIDYIEYQHNIKLKNVHNHYRNNKLMYSEEMLKYLAIPNNYLHVTYCVWSKMYKRDLIDSLSFPVGKIYEEILFNIKAILAAKRIAYVGGIYYLYRIRKGSTTQETDINKYTDKLFRDWMSLTEEKNLFLKQNVDISIFNAHLAVDYSSLLYFYSLNTNTKFKHQILLNLENWKLSFSEIAKLPFNSFSKMLFFFKMKLPSLFVVYYKLKRLFK